MRTTAFQQAKSIFDMGKNCSAVLEKDYEIAAAKISVVGSPGTCRPAPSFQLDLSDINLRRVVLFNGTEVHRKGASL